MRAFRFIFKHWFLLVLLAASGGNGIAQASETNSPWSRIVMIGASASAGVTLAEPFGGTNTLKCRLNYYLDAAITAPHEPVTNLAHAMFFLQPEVAGQMQIDRAVKMQPTLVVAADFLFWFSYGRGTNDAE